MPRGSGLNSQLMAKRRELESAIADIDRVIRITGGKRGRGSRSGKPMSEEHKKKLSLAAKKRHAKAHTETPHRSKAINRPRPKEQGQAAAASA